jgi:hypothetical protein
MLWIRIGSGFNGFPGSGFRRAKMTQKNIKQVIISSLEVVDVLYEVNCNF